MSHELGFELRSKRLPGCEGTLAASPDLAGPDFAAADIMMAYPCTTFSREIRLLDLTPCPAIEDWIRRLEARPVFRKATTPAGGSVSS